MDWKLITFCYSVFVSICGVVGFCIIKFNDFVHIEKKVDSLDEKIDKLEEKQNNRHEENLIALGKIAKDIAYLKGKQEGKE